MKTSKMKYCLDFVVLSFFLTPILSACGDFLNDKASTDGATVAAIPSNSGVSPEAYLATSPTGQQCLSDLNQLKAQGYTVQYLSVGTETLKSVNGHNGGGYSVKGHSIVIFMNKDLSNQEQAHVIAHELVHIQDDMTVDTVLAAHPDINSAAEDYVKNYKNPGALFDTRVVSYVLKTLFCTETRAYTRNQNLSSEGLKTDYFAKGDVLAQYIDQTYISKFGKTFGDSAAQNLASWCLEDSMLNIQNKLMWNSTDKQTK